MKKIILLPGPFLAWPAWAHHTRDHMMLAQEAQQVIAETRQGAGAEVMWLIWGALILMLMLGAIRWWRSRQ